LAQTEETEIKVNEGRLKTGSAGSSAASSVLDTIKEESLNSQLESMEATNSREDADAAMSECRKANAETAIAQNEWKEATIAMRKAEEDLRDSADDLAVSGAGVSKEARKIKEQEVKAARLGLFRATNALARKIAHARRGNRMLATTCATAEFLRMESATAQEETA
jgi:hypothetical protein